VLLLTLGRDWKGSGSTCDPRHWGLGFRRRGRCCPKRGADPASLQKAAPRRRWQGKPSRAWQGARADLPYAQRPTLAPGCLITAQNEGAFSCIPLRIDRGAASTAMAVAEYPARPDSTTRKAALQGFRLQNPAGAGRVEPDEEFGGSCSTCAYGGRHEPRPRGGRDSDISARGTVNGSASTGLTQANCGPCLDAEVTEHTKTDTDSRLGSSACSCPSPAGLRLLNSAGNQGKVASPSKNGWEAKSASPWAKRSRNSTWRSKATLGAVGSWVEDQTTAAEAPGRGITNGP